MAKPCNSTPVYFEFKWCKNDSCRFSGCKCGNLPNKEINEYMDKIAQSTLCLRNKKTKTCSNYIVTHTVNPHIGTSAVYPFEKQITITFDGAYLPLCKIRTLRGCIRKIKNGTCKDPFMIENVGKVFFANKYKDDNQRG